MCLTTGKGQLTGFQVIGNIEKRRVREIGIWNFFFGKVNLVKKIRQITISFKRANKITIRTANSTFTFTHPPPPLSSREKSDAFYLVDRNHVGVWFRTVNPGFQMLKIFVHRKTTNKLYINRLTICKCLGRETCSSLSWLVNCLHPLFKSVDLIQQGWSTTINRIGAKQCLVGIVASSPGVW